MASTLERLGAVHTGDVGTSNFVKPLRIFYELDGKERKWDMVTTHPSVGIIVYHRQKESLLIVRQFRPPVGTPYLHGDRQVLLGKQPLLHTWHAP